MKRGLGNRRFEIMVLFSCLANMVEVSYTLNDVTRYLVGSQDEIRLVNRPPGQYQIRGLRFEQIVRTLKKTPSAAAAELGRAMVDSHVDNYEQEVILPSDGGPGEICRFAGGMALVDAAAMHQLAQALDSLSQQLISHSSDPGVVRAMQAALSGTQPFASFLNLEYYDLHGFVSRLHTGLHRSALKSTCDQILDLLSARVLVYARHTSGRAARGMSIYLSHPRVPENIFQTHQALYQDNRFSRDTHWDEMIQLFRPLLKRSIAAGRSRSEEIKKGQALSTSTHPVKTLFRQHR